MATDDKVLIGTGQALRNIKVQTVVNGVLTDVLMEVVSIADSQGNIIDDFMDYDAQKRNTLLLEMILGQLIIITGNDSFITTDLFKGEE